MWKAVLDEWQENHIQRIAAQYNDTEVATYTTSASSPSTTRANR